jgi:hypothetical protein
VLGRERAVLQQTLRDALVISEPFYELETSQIACI